MPLLSVTQLLGGDGVIKDGAGILHQIYRFRGDVNSWGSMIH